MAADKSNSTSEGKGLTSFAVKNNITVMVVVFMLILAGIASYIDLPKQQDPGFIIRNVVLTTFYPGANPNRVEQLITDKLEEVLQEIPEIDYIESDSRTGFSFVNVAFQEKYTDMRPLFDAVRRKVNDLKDEAGLPNGIFGPFVNDEYGDVFGILYALQGDGFSDAELKEIADEVRNDLLGLEGVGKVKLFGVQDEVIYIEYNGARLQQLGLTPTSLRNSLANANILESGGDIRVGQERIVLEPSGNYETVDALRQTVIRLPANGGVTYLGNIANISRGYVEPAESMNRYNGADTLVIGITLKAGGDILSLDETLNAAVPKIESSYPYGVTIKKVFSQPQLVEDSVNSFMSNLAQAIAIVAGVMFLFLGFRTGIVVASLIPASIVVTFVCMSFFGITVNQISLAALIIALGLLVDNAIVIAESIMIRRENGEDKYSAAIAAGNEMSIPLLISSLTTCSAFLAIFLAESAVGEYTADIFKVVSIALISSWLMAMTFIPLMTILVMKVSSSSSENGITKDSYSGFLYRVYRSLLFPSLRFRFVPLLAGIVLFIIAVLALPLVPQVFIPERDDPIINAKFEMPRGTDITVTKSIMLDLERYMLENHFAKNSVDGQPVSGIVDILSFIGIGTPRYVLAISPDQEESHIAAMIINLTEPGIIENIVEDVELYAAANYPDLTVKMRKMENGTPIDYPIEIRVTGDNIDTLYELIEPLKSELLTTNGIRDVNDDWGMRRKKLQININQDRARRAGVTNSDVALSLQTGLSGFQLTEFRDGNDIIPVTLRSVSAERQNLSKLEGLTVYAQSGESSVPLRQVADIELVWEEAIIKRRDRLRTITVRTMHFPGATATQVLETFNPWLIEQAEIWPEGYSYEMGGEMETSEDASASIAAKLPISGVLIILLLVAQFNNIRKSAIIICTIPLGLIGVTFGLLVANTIFGFFTILGLISLAGIIINNAIVLIDRINIELEQNDHAPADAIIEACQQRLRPILLTTCTTVGGMLPLWISHDPMFETMAVAIIFGLLFATLLTLILVPVLYSLFFGVTFSKKNFEIEQS